MLFCCWSTKGGSGTTVVSAALSLVLARGGHSEVLLVDFGGDIPAVLGIQEPAGPGLGEWVAAGDDVPADGLSRIEIAATTGLKIVARGRGSFESLDRIEVLAALLAGDSRDVVVDLGRIDQNPAAPILAASATHSLLVTRPCFLSLRRAVDLPVRPSGVVVVGEPGRALCAADVEAVVGTDVLVELDVDPAVSRAVDAGLLVSRLPRGLERAIRKAV